MDATAIESQIADLPDLLPGKLTPRDLTLPEVPGRADVVIGMRRSGKTWFLYQHLQRLRDGGTGWDQLLHLNFEDDRLHPISPSELNLIPEVFYRRFPESRNKKVWFFLDEVQEAQGWERFVRRLLDRENVSLVLTGSSAKLLSREIATSLRGRSLATELLPFSFGESLAHAGIEYPPLDRAPSSKVRSMLAHHLDRYLEVGGFPEVQTLDRQRRIRILQDQIDVVLLRDVIERHRLENVVALRRLQKALLKNPAQRFSVHRLYNDLKSQGVRVGKDTLHEYLAHLEDAFLLFTISVASRSERVKQSNPRKCYPVDPGLAWATSTATNLGHRLETVIYLELRRRNAQVSYLQTKGGYEVDFLAEYPSERSELIQVCADPSGSETRRREIRALQEAIQETKLDQATIITMDFSDADELEETGIRLVPAWRWLLERA